MPFTVYVLKSQRDGRHYIGQTGNLKQRLRMHDLGLVESTRHRRPLVLIYREDFDNRKKARERERFLKRQKGGDVFKKIVGGDARGSPAAAGRQAHNLEVVGFPPSKFIQNGRRDPATAVANPTPATKHANQGGAYRPAL